LLLGMVLGLLLPVSGCGKKGPLYLPDTARLPQNNSASILASLHFGPVAQEGQH
jgi:predicted small lipoprotein YifL